MMDKVEKKRQKEQHVVEEMIRLYCRKKHPKEDRQAGQICPVCQELLDYARLRSEKCPFMKEKTFCANCKVHCYKPEVREQIRQVMRHHIIPLLHLPVILLSLLKFSLEGRSITGGIPKPLRYRFFRLVHSSCR